MGWLGAPRWDVEDAPDQRGRVVVITGANSGLGLDNAEQLARLGATVLMACRSRERGERAAEQVKGRVPGALIEVVDLDLSDLASVQAAAERIGLDHDRVDLLLNNAGVMALPRQLTADGFEMQLGTNHLGHFALTGRLLPLLEAAGPGARVVNVASAAHYIGRIRFDDLMGEQSYQPWLAYGQSKLANLLFTFSLQRRLAARGSAVISTAAHPGYAATNLTHVAPKQTGNKGMAAFMSLGAALVAQPSALGALPTLYAAVHPELAGGEYIGPGLFGWRGYPTAVGCADKARHQEVQDRLWAVSEELTSVRYLS